MSNEKNFENEAIEREEESTVEQFNIPSHEAYYGHYDMIPLQADMRFGGGGYGYGRRPHYGYGRPNYGYGFAGPFLGGVLGGVLGSALFPPYGYGGYPYYYGAPYYPWYY